MKVTLLKRWQSNLSPFLCLILYIKNNVQIKSTFEDVDLNKIENNESEEQLYKDWLESNNLLDQGVRDAYKNSIENKFKELYHDDINSYHSRKLNSQFMYQQATYFVPKIQFTSWQRQQRKKREYEKKS